MDKYNCPDCIMVEPECSNCVRTYSPPKIPATISTPHPCDGCPSKPRHGEFKVCHCILGSPSITCTSSISYYDRRQSSQGPGNSDREVLVTYGEQT